jgi:serine/threonine-protein kinase
MSADAAPKPGSILAGVYRVESVLGVGGMGAVVAAKHLELGRRVAIKVMLPKLAEQLAQTARFAREARAIAALKSEHVARLFETGRLDDGSPFLVMELLEGATVEHVLRTRGPLPIGESVGYVIEVLDGLAEAHGLGIVHRDLKLSNLFLADRAGRAPIVKVLDFGIAKIAPLLYDLDPTTITETGLTLGSPMYMSPEQLRSSKSVDARADIFAVGVILHRLITGQFPFSAESMGEYFTKLVSEPPTPLRALRPEAPEALEKVVLRCLEKTADRRYQSAAELARALAPFAQATYADLAPSIDAHPRMAPEPSSDEPATRIETKIPAPTESTHAGTARSLPAKASARWSAAVGAGLALIALIIGVVATGAFERAQLQSAAVPTASALVQADTIGTAAPRVMVRLVITPTDAVVELDGAPISDRALTFEKADRPHDLVIRAPGYVTERRTLSSMTDLELQIHLEKDERAATPSTAQPAPASRPTRAPTPGAGRATQPQPTSAPTATPTKKDRGPMETTL